MAQWVGSEHCRVVRETFDRVRDKWSLLVIVIGWHRVRGVLRLLLDV